MASPAVATTNTSAVTTAGTSHIVNLPASIAAGDLLLIFFAEMAPTTTPSTVSNVNWTEVPGFVTRRTTTQALWAFYRWADGAEGSTVTFTSSVSTKSAHTSYRITEAENPSTQAPEAGAGANGSSVDADPPSVAGTGGSKDYLFITAAAVEGEVYTPNAAPANYTNRLLIDTGTAGAVGVNGMILTAERQLTAASDNPGVFDTPTDDWVANTLVVHPQTAALVTPAAVTATATLPASSILAAALLVPSVVAAVSTLPTATVSVPATATSAVITAAATLPSPTINVEGGSTTVTPVVISATVAFFNPAVLAAVLTTPTVVTAAAALPTVTITAAVLVEPTVIPLVASLPTPTTLADGTFVTPAAVALMVLLPASAIRGGSKNPVAFTRNPAGFVRIGGGDTPPWN